jgi:hypothetical protein
MGFASTVLGVAAFAASERRYWAWLAIAGLVVLVAAFGWTAHDEREARLKLHPHGDESRRQTLRSLLDAAAQRLEYLGTVDSPNLKWMWDQSKDRSQNVYALIDLSLGPVIAEEFARAGASAVQGMQAEMGDKATFVRSLAGRLDSIPIMKDWHP